jgi:hypothetical protein
MLTGLDDKNDSLIISYLALRRYVGIIGMGLPFFLILGYFIFNDNNCNFPPSISHFYYTDMGNWFVGTLCAISLFMFCYNGPEKKDLIAAKIAGIFALLTAMFPTNYGAYENMECSRIAGDGFDKTSNAIHYFSAGILFSTLAYFCLVLFTKTNKPGPMAGPKKTRNGIYKFCGWVMIFCIAAIAVLSFVDSLYQKLRPIKPTFVLETVSLMAFGFSWFVKGETIFKDKK